MDTLTLDRTTPIDTLFAFIGAERVTATRETPGRVVLMPEEAEVTELDTTTPATQGEVDALYDAINPNHIHINPDDYEDDTAYLEAIPGMVDYLTASMRLPLSAGKVWE